MTKFVAGPARLEANPLGEPARQIRTISPNSISNSSYQHQQNVDLSNPDA